MDIEHILARFEDVTDKEDGYLARCSAHSDSKPSLVIFYGTDGKVRLTCRAGCDTKDVIKAAGLSWSDLFSAEGSAIVKSAERPKPVGPSHAAPLMMYAGQRAGEFPGSAAESYSSDRFGVSPDDSSRLMLGDAPVHTGFKHTGQSFEKFHRLTVPFISFSGVVHGLQGRDLSGGCPGRWVSLTNPDGHEWGKYGLMTGAGQYDAIIVSEGPGDGLTAVGVGYDALAIRGASMANNPALVAEIAAGLAALGKQVIIAGDNDKAGRKFTRTLSRALAEHKVAVYNLTIPTDGWDLTDWRADNPSAFPSALHSAVKAAAPYSETEGLLVDAATGALIPNAVTAAEAMRLINEYSERYGNSDVLCASALVAFTGKTIKYATGIGFYFWDGTSWVSSDMRVRQQAHFLGASLSIAADAIADKDQRKAKLALAGRFMNSRTLDNIMTELKAIPDVQVQPDDFDSHDHLLSFRNGVVDLRTGALRNHSPDDMLTVSLPIEYAPDAKAPRWEQFLSEIMPDHPEMPAYLQRLTGYGITGNVSEQCFSVLWGKGANGKSVFTDTLTEIFSGVTVTTPFATFEEKRNGGIPNDVAALRGARLVMASEGEAGKPMSEAVLKRVTGKDKVTARFMRQEFFTFSPTFLIMLATNHKPSFRGQDEGLWRRVKLIPFMRYFAPEDRDYSLGDKLLAESAGIVAWAVRGAVDWYANGLQDPDVVKEATQEYREASDELSGFMPGVIEYTGSDSDKILGADLMQLYLDWCVGENIPKGQEWRTKTFYKAMEERKAVKRRASKGMAFYGIRVAGQAPDPPAGPGIFGSDSPAIQNFEEDMATIKANVSHAILTRTELPPIVSRNDPGQD